MGFRMVAVGFFGLWVFYGIGTWGYCLVKGYNVTFGQWFNPMKPYEWNGSPDRVPAGSVLPTGKAAAASTAKAQVA